MTQVLYLLRHAEAGTGARQAMIFPGRSVQLEPAMPGWFPDGCLTHFHLPKPYYALPPREPGTRSPQYCPFGRSCLKLQITSIRCIAHL